MIGKLIIDRLTVSSTLQDSQGNGIKLHNQRKPQNESIAAVVYNVINEIPSYCKSAINDTDEARVQLDIYHPHDYEAQWIAENKVRSVLEGWAGTFESIRYNYTTLESKRTGYNDEFSLHFVSMDFIIRKVKN